MSGTLFVLATPIGNLGDLSPRAADVLRRVPAVAAEDTRQTRKLLDHVGSRAELVSCHAHSPPERLAELVARVESGQDLAVCTDAGTPGVSDPGPALVARARAAGLSVIPVPGPSAVATVLMASGLPADRFVFLGFPPRKGRDRGVWIERIKGETLPVVCFEAPGRVGDLLADLAEACGPDRWALVGREMTKKFEEYRGGSLGELQAWAAAEVRGEVTLVVAGAAEAPPAVDREGAASLAAALVDAGVERSTAARVVAQVHGLRRNESYRLFAED
ncbi:MAG: 16S rRNA (cytidine(1402)-2'-O)-methyltransferase [Gemmatimonadales bacterium]